MAEVVGLTIQGRIATLTLERPEARNSLSLGMLAAFHSRVDELRARTDVSVLVVTGAGKAFCAGMDLKAVLADHPSQREGLGEGGRVGSAPVSHGLPLPPPRDPEARDRARVLRRQMTGPEEVLWAGLKGKRLEGFKFRRQHPLGPYIADFYCHEVRLVVELDGQSHRESRQRDAQRTAWLGSFGIEVVRFSDDQALQSTEGVLQQIRDVAMRLSHSNPPPTPPSGRGADSTAQRLLLSLAEVCQKIRAMPMITLASVNGAAIGGGCGLATVCDLAVTHADSKMGFPEVDLGVCPAVVAPWLVRKIGAGRARAVLLSGGVMTGAQAHAAGIVDRVVATLEELEPACRQMADRLATGGPNALRATKQLLNELDGSLDDALARRGALLSADVLQGAEAQTMLRAKLGG